MFETLVQKDEWSLLYKLIGIISEVALLIVQEPSGIMDLFNAISLSSNLLIYLKKSVSDL